MREYTLDRYGEALNSLLTYPNPYGMAILSPVNSLVNTSNS